MDKLETLTRHPEWDIRHAAYAIILDRFNHDRYCIRSLSERVDHATKTRDNNDFSLHNVGLFSLGDDVGIPVRRTYWTSRSDGSISPRGAHRNISPVSGRDEEFAVAARRQAWFRRSNSTSPARGIPFLSTMLSSSDAQPSRYSPVDDQLRLRGGRFTEELDEDAADSDDESISSEERRESTARREAEAEEAAATSMMFDSLPFAPEEEDAWSEYGTQFAATRRRHHREAIVVGHPDDGIEVIQQPDSPVVGEIARMRGGDVDNTGDENEARAAGELIQQVRGLEGQVQGLLDTLHQFEEAGEET